MPLTEDQQKNACAEVLSAVILRLADIFIAKGKTRKQALLLAAAVVSESSSGITRVLM